MPVAPAMWARVAAAACSGVAFGVALYGGLLTRGAGDWCVSCWGISSAGSLLLLLVEACGLQGRVPVSWRNLTVTFACYAALLCLSASFVFPLFFLRGFGGREEVAACRAASTAFSCLATLAYLGEVGVAARERYSPGYMATTPGLLKVCQTFVACAIFILVADPVSYSQNAAAGWCLAVYCVCFVLSAAVVLACVAGCPVALPRLLTTHALLAAALYLTAAVLWPVYKFAGGDAHRPAACGSSVGLCPWDKLLTVAALTALNFLLYLADLVYCARQLAAGV